MKNDIDGLNGIQLSKELRHTGSYFSVKPDSFKVLKSVVGVNKKINNDGDFVYIPTVKVSYEYSYIKNS